MRVRLAKLKRAIVQVVGVNDVFGLREPALLLNASTTPILTNVAIPGQGAYKFLRSSDKVDTFMSWLQEAQKDSILEVSTGTARSVTGSGAWTDVYIETAYQKGLGAAGTHLKKQGFDISENYVQASFLNPVHADRAGLIFTRAFNELQGITAAMDQQISRVLAQGIAEGKGPKAISRDLLDRVDKIAKPRAETLARTEVIGAHAEAALNSYKEAGLNEVQADVEFATAGDSRVCPRCEALEGQVFTIMEASGMIPVHPNCRCTWLPIVKV